MDGECDTSDQVNEYKYLESNETEDGRSSKGIINRINQAKCAFQNKNK